MKLIDYKETYYFYSGKVSDIARQSSFAGFAIIWIFKGGDRDIIFLDYGLMLSAIFFTICLTCDLLQYIYQTAAWGIYHWRLEKDLGKKIKNIKLLNNKEVDHNEKINILALILFWLKLVFVIVGYIILSKYILENILITGR